MQHAQIAHSSDFRNFHFKANDGCSDSHTTMDEGKISISSLGDLFARSYQIY